LGLPVRSDVTEGSDNSEKAGSRVLVDDVRAEWKLLWHSRIDDKVRAEGVANQDFSLLFVERGTVIVATRDFRPLNFREILRLHKIQHIDRFVSPPPSVGGWTKFARTELNNQKRVRKWKESPCVPVRNRRKKLQLKKGGRGWLHSRMNV